MYTSAFASRAPWLSYAVYVSSGSQGASCFSTHLSGIVNGFTHSIAFEGAASAVASAWMSAVSIWKYFAMSVFTCRNTVTCTRFATPVVGFVGKVTSAGVTVTV